MERKLEVKVETRLYPAEAKAMDECVLLHRDLYENRAHFIRAAIIRQINAVRGDV